MTTLRYDRLPVALRESVQLYVEHGIPPGHFLTAVLENDLRGACERADDVNRHLLWEIVGWFYNEAPAPCWGSPTAVRRWMEQRKEER